MKYILLVLSLLIIGVRIYGTVNFDRKCVQYIQRAADANTVTSAYNELGVATKYLEDNKITSGYTSIMFDSPNEDVGFWYNNLKSCEKDLLVIIDNDTSVSMLEKSNVLLRLRETLLDKKGVTVPSGISRYPNNLLWGIISGFAIIYIFIFLFLLQDLLKYKW